MVDKLAEFGDGLKELGKGLTTCGCLLLLIPLAAVLVWIVLRSVSL